MPDAAALSPARAQGPVGMHLEVGAGLLHAVDSNDPRGSHRDRHERVGEGRLGIDPFRELLRLRDEARGAPAAGPVASARAAR